MVYKFNSDGLRENDKTCLEFSHEAGRLQIISSDYDNEMHVNFHLLELEEMDDMIIALTNIRNEIVQFREGVGAR
jgi:hypothetical protein